MNHPAPVTLQDRTRRTIVGADGLPRLAFTVADVDRMVEAGIIHPDERLEIVDGEIMPMAPKGPLHEILRRHLNRHLARELPDAFGHMSEPGWRLLSDLYLEPDFVVFPAEREIVGLKGSEALLVVELSHSTLEFDLGRKAAKYAEAGVREYWVVDVADRSTRVHRDPEGDRFRTIETVPADAVLRPALVPSYQVRLGDLPGM